MSLSEREQRALHEIERSLFAEDPRFAASVAGQDSTPEFLTGRVTLRGVALVVVGLVLLIAGVALAQNSVWFVAVSILGFLIMFGSGVWMLKDKGSSSSKKKQSTARGGSLSGSSSDQSSLGKRMEESFRHRFLGF